MNPRSSLYLEVWHIVIRHSSIASRILFCTLVGRIGGRSGKRRTSSLRNSLVLIWRWNGYPQFLTQISSSCQSISPETTTVGCASIAYSKGEEGDIRISMIDVVYYGYCSFSGSEGISATSLSRESRDVRIAFFGVNEVSNL